MSELERLPQIEQSQERSVLQNAVSKVVVGLAGVSLVFEQSPANEALRTNVAFDVLEQTQSAATVGLTVAGVTAAIEFGSAALITAGLHGEEGAIQRLKNRIKEKNASDAELDRNLDRDGVAEEDSSKKSSLSKVADIGADTALALGVGAGIVTMKHHIADPEPSVKKDLKVSAAATGVVSGVSGAIGYLAAGGINHAEDTIFETPAEYFVDYASDAKFWIGALVVGYGTYYAKKGIQKMRGKIAERKNRNSKNIQEFLLARDPNRELTSRGAEDV